MMLGVLAGHLGGNQVAVLNEFAVLFIDLIKTFATPLLFFAILDAILRSQISSKSFWVMIGLSISNAILACCIGMLCLKFFPISTDSAKGILSHLADFGSGTPVLKMSWVEALRTLYPKSLVAPFLNHQIPAIIVLAILIGVALRKMFTSENRKRALEQSVIFTESCMSLFGKLLGYVIYLVPLAVFGSVAKVTGQYGFGVFKELGVFVLIVLTAMILQFVLVYSNWVRWFGGVKIRDWWRELKTPFFYSFGVNSSLATLSQTLKGLKNLKVSDSSARMSACIGTNFNNDGILLYEIVASLFLAKMYGIDLSAGQQVLFALFGIIATLGVSGVPEAGIVALTLLTSYVGLPPEGVTILLSVDWFLARCRSAVNVSADFANAITIDGVLRKMTSSS